jgi:hypothetical protein
MSDEAEDQLGSNLEPAVTPTIKPKRKAKTERTWIILEENEDIPPTGLYLGHNGNGFLLKAGEPANVPNEIIEILDHAVTSMPQIDPITRQVLGHRDRMRFPYRRVDAPADAE